MLFDNAVITDIESPIMVNSEKGRIFEMKNRKNFGLSFCVNGQITYKMGEQTVISTPNRVVLLPKNSTYSLYGNKQGLFPVINFDCDNLSCDKLLSLPINNPQGYIKNIEKIKNLFLFKENKLKIYSIFYEILDRLSKESLPQENPLYNAVKFLESNISNPELSNSMLANKAGISEIYFRKLFYKQYNTTPKQYILDVRIKKAKLLLTESAFSVGVISEECGFSSLYHFCRAFKDKTGLTPTEYAKYNKIYEI